MRELTAALAPDLAGGSAWQRSCISLGIDAANDLGIVVPVTRYNEAMDIAYRCYRIGETTPLAERPLPAAVREGHLDALVQSVDHGYPVHNYTVAIDEAGMKAAAVAQASSRAVLEADVRIATPGVVRSCYEGTVTDLDQEQGFFSAQLVDPIDGEQRTAELRDLTAD